MQLEEKSQPSQLSQFLAKVNTSEKHPQWAFWFAQPVFISSWRGSCETFPTS